MDFASTPKCVVRAYHLLPCPPFNVPTKGKFADLKEKFAVAKRTLEQHCLLCLTTDRCSDSTASNQGLHRIFEVLRLIANLKMVSICGAGVLVLTVQEDTAVMNVRKRLCKVVGIPFAQAHLLLDGHVQTGDTTLKQPALTTGILLRLVFASQIKAHVTNDQKWTTRGNQSLQ